MATTAHAGHAQHGVDEVGAMIATRNRLVDHKLAHHVLGGELAQGNVFSLN